MARQCAVCGKKGMMVWRRVKLRGKYNPTIKKKKYPNLQWAKLPASPSQGGASGKRVKACTRCIKTLGKK